MPYKDPEKYRSYHAAWYDAHREKERARSADYAAAHREEARARSVAWREAHPGYAAKYLAAHYNSEKARWTAYHASHREERRAYCLSHRAERKIYDAGRKVENAARTAARKSMLMGATLGSLAEIKEIYRRARESPNARCYLCGELIPLGHRHVDHIVPLSKGGAHRPSNLAIACSFCNLSKKDKMPEEVGVLL